MTPNYIFSLFYHRITFCIFTSPCLRPSSLLLLDCHLELEASVATSALAATTGSSVTPPGWGEDNTRKHLHSCLGSSADVLLVNSCQHLSTVVNTCQQLSTVPTVAVGAAELRAAMRSGCIVVTVAHFPFINTVAVVVVPWQ